MAFAPKLAKPKRAVHGCARPGAGSGMAASTNNAKLATLVQQLQQQLRHVTARMDGKDGANWQQVCPDATNDIRK